MQITVQAIFFQVLPLRKGSEGKSYKMPWKSLLLGMKGFLQEHAYPCRPTQLGFLN